MELGREWVECTSLVKQRYSLVDVTVCLEVIAIVLI